MKVYRRPKKAEFVVVDGGSRWRIELSCGHPLELIQISHPTNLRRRCIACEKEGRKDSDE